MSAAPVFDSDGHVLEPRDAWRSLPERFRPRIETQSNGLDHVIIDDQVVFIAKLGMMGTPGTDVTAVAGAVPLEEAQPGAFDPVASVTGIRGGLRP